MSLHLPADRRQSTQSRRPPHNALFTPFSRVAHEHTHAHKFAGESLQTFFWMYVCACVWCQARSKFVALHSCNARLIRFTYMCVCVCVSWRLVSCIWYVVLVGAVLVGAQCIHLHPCWKRIDDINNASALFHLRCHPSPPRRPAARCSQLARRCRALKCNSVCWRLWRQCCKDILWQEDVKCSLYFIER